MAGLETGFHSKELFLGGGGEAVGRKPPANRTMETSLLTAARVLRTTDAPLVSSAPTCADPVFNADVLEPVARRSPRRGICNAIKPVGPPLAAAAAAAAREASPLAAGGARSRCVMRMHPCRVRGRHPSKDTPAAAAAAAATPTVVRLHAAATLSALRCHRPLPFAPSASPCGCQGVHLWQARVPGRRWGAPVGSR